MIAAIQLRATTDRGALLTAGTLNWADILQPRQTPPTQSTPKGDPGDERIEAKAQKSELDMGRQTGESIGRLR